MQYIYGTNNVNDKQTSVIYNGRGLYMVFLTFRKVKLMFNIDMKILNWL